MIKLISPVMFLYLGTCMMVEIDIYRMSFDSSFCIYMGLLRCKIFSWFSVAHLQIILSQKALVSLTYL